MTEHSWSVSQPDQESYRLGLPKRKGHSLRRRSRSHVLIVQYMADEALFSIADLAGFGDLLGTGTILTHTRDLTPT